MYAEVSRPPTVPNPNPGPPDRQNLRAFLHLNTERFAADEYPGKSSTTPMPGQLIPSVVHLTHRPSWSKRAPAAQPQEVELAAASVLTHTSTPETSSVSAPCVPRGIKGSPKAGPKSGGRKFIVPMLKLGRPFAFPATRCPHPDFRRASGAHKETHRHAERGSYGAFHNLHMLRARGHTAHATMNIHGHMQKTSGIDTYASMGCVGAA